VERRLESEKQAAMDEAAGDQALEEAQIIWEDARDAERAAHRLAYVLVPNALEASLVPPPLDFSANVPSLSVSLALSLSLSRARSFSLSLSLSLTRLSSRAGECTRVIQRQRVVSGR
jgi:hypothetical protein